MACACKRWQYRAGQRSAAFAYIISGHNKVEMLCINFMIKLTVIEGDGECIDWTASNSYRFVVRSSIPLTDL